MFPLYLMNFAEGNGEVHRIVWRAGQAPGPHLLSASTPCPYRRPGPLAAPLPRFGCQKALGRRLEQGAKYLDLAHLEQDEFTATAGMVADEGHYYVPKKATDYVLWNQLNQVSTPARLDESGE